MEETQAITEHEVLTWDELDVYKERINKILLPASLAGVLEIIKSNFPENKLDIKSSIYDDALRVIKRYYDIKTRNQLNSRIEDECRRMKIALKSVAELSDEELSTSELFESVKRKFAIIVSETALAALTTVTIYFPYIKVTNENHNSVYVNDIYCRFNITYKGILYGKPEYIKATYTEDMFNSGYVHSHMPRAHGDNVCVWRNACYGTGPIAFILPKLQNESEVDEIYWMQFCYELPRFLACESIEGHPYIPMSSINNSSGTTMAIMPTKYKESRGFNKYLYGVKFDVAVYLLKNKMLKFSYADGKYKIGMTPFEYLKALTKAIHDLWKENSNKYFYTDMWSSIKSAYLGEYLFNEFGSFMIKIDTHGRQTNEINELNGRKLLDFKGTEIKLNIISKRGKEQKTLWLAHTCLAEDVHQIIDYLINSSYGQSISKKSNNQWVSDFIPFNQSFKQI